MKVLKLASVSRRVMLFPASMLETRLAREISLSSTSIGNTVACNCGFMFAHIFENICPHKKFRPSGRVSYSVKALIVSSQAYFSKEPITVRQ
jgi:hypothetical protein